MKDLIVAGVVVYILYKIFTKKTPIIVINVVDKREESTTKKEDDPKVS